MFELLYLYTNNSLSNYDSWKLNSQVLSFKRYLSNVNNKQTIFIFYFGNLIYDPCQKMGALEKLSLSRFTFHWNV